MARLHALAQAEARLRPTGGPAWLAARVALGTALARTAGPEPRDADLVALQPWWWLGHDGLRREVNEVRSALL